MTSKKAVRCRNAAGLLSRRLDDGLGVTEHLGLRFHLLLCSGCRNYGHQLKLMRSATKKWQSYQEDGAQER